jgi:hypothetical protein
MYTLYGNDGRTVVHMSCFFFCLISSFCHFYQAIPYSCNSRWRWPTGRYFWNNIGLWELDTSWLWCCCYCFWRSRPFKWGSTIFLCAKQVSLIVLVSIFHFARDMEYKIMLVTWDTKCCLLKGLLCKAEEFVMIFVVKRSFG